MTVTRYGVPTGKHCVNCGRPLVLKESWGGRCQKCAVYFRANGTENPHRNGDGRRRLMSRTGYVITHLHGWLHTSKGGSVSLDRAHVYPTLAEALRCKLGERVVSYPLAQHLVAQYGRTIPEEVWQIGERIDQVNALLKDRP